MQAQLTPTIKQTLKRLGCALAITVGLFGSGHVGCARSGLAANEIEADRVVFYVNDDIITQHDLQKRMELFLRMLRSQGQPTPRGRDVQWLRYKLAQDLIEEVPVGARV